MNFYPNNKAQRGVVFSGPSGSGKSTIVKHLLRNSLGVDFSISACTRPKRPNEVHGRDYYFFSVQEFKRKIAQRAFIEWEEVYEGHYYGTLESELIRIWSAKKTALFDVDVHGGLKLKDCLKENALAIYIQAPSLEVLAERLISRGTETKESVMRRINKATYEDSLATQFDFVLVNGKLEDSLSKAQALLDQFSSATERCK